MLLGLTLRHGDGIQLIKGFRKLDTEAKVLVFSAREDALWIHRALRAGARGYLRADDDVTEIVKALDEISIDHRYLSAGVLGRLVENFAGDKKDGAGFEFYCLSDRELEIFGLMGKGFGVSKLAAELFTSPKTIESHQQRMKEKLDLRSGSALKEKATKWVFEQTRERLHVASLG